MADAERPIEFLAGDLAPGDGKSRDLDWRGLDIVRIQSSGDPLFDAAYGRLWSAFGAQDEMESRELIEQRLAWHPAKAMGDCWLRYELLLVRRQGQFVAVRDHTAVVTRRKGTPQAVVHLSHVFIDPAWRRTGLSGWLRAAPIQTARACLMAGGFPTDSPVTLLAEMEHPDPAFPDRMIRLKAYEKAGFKKVDPSVVKYFQPDFRRPAAIEASGGPRPLPFGLVLRRLGRESELAIQGAEARELVTCLYQMYAAGFRAGDMAAVWNTLRDYPDDDAWVALIAPTQ